MTSNSGSGQAIRIGIVSDIMDYAMFWYADHAQLFIEEGLDVEVTVTYSVQGVVDGLRSGNFDLAVGAPEAILAQAGPDSELVIIGGTTHRLMLSLMGSPSVHSLHDLHNATLGASSATEGTALLMMEMLRSAGIDTTTVRIEPIGVGEVRLHALLDGRIDAGTLNIPVSYEGAEKGLHVLGSVADAIPEYQFVTINARREWLSDETNASIVRRVLQVLIHAIDGIYSDDNESVMVQLLQEKMGVTAESARRGWDDFRRIRPVARDLRLSEEAVTKTVSTMRQAGTLDADQPVRLSDIYDTSFLAAIPTAESG